MRSGELMGNDTGGAAQVAAAHCPNERTLDPAVCSQTDHGPLNKTLEGCGQTPPRYSFPEKVISDLRVSLVIM